MNFLTNDLKILLVMTNFAFLLHQNGCLSVHRFHVLRTHGVWNLQKVPPSHGNRDIFVVDLITQPFAQVADRDKSGDPVIVLITECFDRLG